MIDCVCTCCILCLHRDRQVPAGRAAARASGGRVWQRTDAAAYSYQSARTQTHAGTVTVVFSQLDSSISQPYALLVEPLSGLPLMMEWHYYAGEVARAHPARRGALRLRTRIHRHRGNTSCCVLIENVCLRIRVCVYVFVRVTVAHVFKFSLLLQSLGSCFAGHQDRLRRITQQLQAWVEQDLTSSSSSSTLPVSSSSSSSS